MTFQSAVSELAVPEPRDGMMVKPRSRRHDFFSALSLPGAFRLFLASAVVINHYTRLQIGTAAVDLFFILSGYWIERMYGRQYASRRRPAFVFISSRVMRLMPLFLLFNLLAILVQQLLHAPDALHHIGLETLPNLTILGYASVHPVPLVPAWSLDIELQFYLLFPLLWTLIPRGNMMLLAVTVLLIAAGIFDIGVVLRDQAQVVLPYLGFFALGLYVARAKTVTPPWAIWIGCGLAILLLVCTLAAPPLRGMFYALDGLPDRGWNALGNIVLALCMAPLAISTLTRKSPPFDRTLGDLSYAVYCSHWIGVTIAAHYLSGLGWHRKLPLILALLLATYLVSLAALVWYDRPLSQLREAWIRRQPLRSSS